MPHWVYILHSEKLGSLISGWYFTTRPILKSLRERQEIGDCF